MDVLAEALGGRRLSVPATDLLGRPVTGEILLTGTATATPTAYVESAQVCGRQLGGEADPGRTTSYGLGVLIAAAVETGARRVVVGLGGSATDDGGAGMLAALGAAAVDAAGYALPYGGAALVHVAGLTGPPRLRQVDLVAATDVDNPLTGPDGASSVFIPRNGASRAAAPMLDTALRRFAAVLERKLPTCPPGLADLPGAGAAGGIVAAILAVGGRCAAGTALVNRLVGLDAEVAAADLVITGVGSFDDRSLRGTVVAEVAAAARARGVPCVVLAARISVDPQDAAAVGVTEMHSLVDYFRGTEGDRCGVDEYGGAQAMTRPAEGLHALAARLAQDRRR